jgi:micrococcal nuclease
MNFINKLTQITLAIAISCLIFSLAGCNLFGTPGTYRVKRVSDGDTIAIADKNGKNITVRFACMDAPEIPHTQQEKNSKKILDKNQFKWGLKARSRLQKLINQAGSRVLLTITDTDQYGRKVAEVRSANGTLMQQTLIQEGLALVYRPYLKNCPSASMLLQAEAEAQKNRRGIWSDPQFSPPWDYRRKSK